MQIYVIAGFDPSSKRLSKDTILYSKGDEAIRSNYPFFPCDENNESYVVFPSFLIRIGRLGKEIAPRFANRYIDHLGIGFDIVSREKILECHQKGIPWDSAIAFQDSVSLYWRQTMSKDNLCKDYTITVYSSDKSQKESISYAISFDLIADAVSKLSFHRKIRQGDCLLLHPDFPFVQTASFAISIHRNMDICGKLDNEEPFLFKIR